MGSASSSRRKASDDGEGDKERELSSSGYVEVIANGGGVGSKASEMNSLLGKAVDVLDTLGSSMTSLNPGSGFKYGATFRGNKVSILAFEVANTIAKGASLMHSLSEENIQFLKKEILVSEGIQRLVSAKNEELLRIAADDKRKEFHVFSLEVARFGDQCKNPEWHNLSRYFQKLDSDTTPQENLREDAETTMQQLINLTQYTSELYHELQALHKFEQDYNRKSQEEDSWPAHQKNGEALMVLNSELKRQKKLVQSLQKKSLWNKNMEEVVEKLVDIVVYLHKAIFEAFGVSACDSKVSSLQICRPQRLGISGLALHYANIINQIENMVSRPLSFPSNARDTLYNGLPIFVKTALRLRIQSFQVKELNATQVKTEMQKILQWLGPMAENTTRAHRGFGWVGEWANMGSDHNKKSGMHVVKIQTLYHADKEKADEYILQLVVWLHNLVDQMKDQEYGFKPCKPLNSPQGKTFFSSVTKLDGWKSLLKLTQEDQALLECASYERIVLNKSRSSGYASGTYKKERKCQRSRSGGSSPIKELGSGFCQEKRKILDSIDGLENPHVLPPVSYCT